MKTMIVDAGRQDLFAWKCEQEDFEFGAQLVVHQSQQAVFFNNGQAIEVLGPGTHTLETSNLPFLRLFNKLRFGRYFHCEVYFINHAVQMAMPWWIDPKVTCELDVGNGRTLPLEIGANGTMNLQADPRQVMTLLNYLLGTGQELTRKNIQEIFRSVLNTAIKDFLANALSAQNCVAFTLDKYLGGISKALQTCLADEFGEYGLDLKKFLVEHIEMPIHDPAYQEAKLAYERKTLAHNKMDLDHELEYKQKMHEAQMAGLSGSKAETEATTEANITAIKAKGEAIRRSYEGITSIQEHQFDTINHMIDANANAPVIAPAGVGMGDMSGLVGDVVKVNLGIQMAQEMAGMVKDAMGTGIQAGQTVASAMGAPLTASGWTCANGHANPDSAQFCPQCGQKKPEPRVPQGWTCANGHANPDSAQYCSQCGQKRPEAPAADWFCSQCGEKNSGTGLFCTRCGNSK